MNQRDLNIMEKILSDCLFFSKERSCFWIDILMLSGYLWQSLDLSALLQRATKHW